MAYTPNEWSVGNLITASKMNKIERQLVVNTSDLDDIRNGVTVPTYEEFETLRDDVSAEYDNTKTYAVGDYVIYNTQLYKCKTAITSAETWTAAHWDAVEVGEELQRIEGKNEEEVAELKSAIDYLQDSNNLFDASTATEGRLQASGSIVVVSGYFTSAHIPVEAGAVYYKNSPTVDAYHRLCVYSSTQHIVRDVTDTNYITIGSGEAYIRFSGVDTEEATTEFYKVSAKDVMAREAITSLATKVGGGFLNAVDETSNVNNAVDGWARVNPSASNVPDAKGGYVCTFTRAASAKAQIFIGADIINGTTKTTLYLRYMYGGTWKAWENVPTHPFEKTSDYSGDLDSFTEGVTRVSATATNNPTGSLGYCIAVKRADSAFLQIFVADGNIYTRVCASGTLTEWVNVSAFGSAYQMSGKNGLSFGDSIMAADGKSFSMYAANAQYNTDKLSGTCVGYQSLLENHYNVTITDYAVSGEGIVQQLPKIKAANYTGIDFVIIACGTNDFSDGRAMGDLPTSKAQATSETTFAGTLCTAVKWIQTQNPTIKIILMTPLQRDTTWRNGGTPDASLYATDIYTQNNKGLYLKDYRDAIISVGEMYGCVVADMYSESGLNYLTLPAYTFEGVHPTNEGYEHIISVLYRAFEKL